MQVERGEEKENKVAKQTVDWKRFYNNEMQAKGLFLRYESKSIRDEFVYLAS